MYTIVLHRIVLLRKKGGGDGDWLYVDLDSGRPSHGGLLLVRNANSNSGNSNIIIIIIIIISGSSSSSSSSTTTTTATTTANTNDNTTQYIKITYLCNLARILTNSQDSD